MSKATDRVSFSAQTYPIRQQITAGPTGATGAVGATGATGDIGPTGPTGIDIDAVIFDGGTTTQNIRSDRSANQSHIDNTKDGIVNLSSNTNGLLLFGAEGNYSTIGGGDQNVAQGDYSTIPGGLSNIAFGTYAIAEGHSTIAFGLASHSEGESTLALGDASHSEGQGNITTGIAGHVEGTNNSASGNSSHAEGFNTIAAEFASHSGGAQSAAPRYGQRALNSSFDGNISPGLRQTSDMVFHAEILPNSDVNFQYGDVITPTPFLNLEDGKAYVIILTAIASGTNGVIEASRGFIIKLIAEVVGGIAFVTAQPLETWGNPATVTWNISVVVTGADSNVSFVFNNPTLFTVNSVAKIEFTETNSPPL